jgi:hypothetical protein
MVRRKSNKMPRWLMGQDPYSRDDSLHYLVHQEQPRFTARWCFGPPKPMPKAGERIFIEKGEGDLVHIFDFSWIDEEPDDTAFAKLMGNAIDTVDQWLENNLSPPTRP